MTMMSDYTSLTSHVRTRDRYKLEIKTVPLCHMQYETFLSSGHMDLGSISLAVHDNIDDAHKYHYNVVFIVQDSYWNTLFPCLTTYVATIDGEPIEVKTWLTYLCTRFTQVRWIKKDECRTCNIYGDNYHAERYHNRIVRYIGKTPVFTIFGDIE